MKGEIFLQMLDLIFLSGWEYFQVLSVHGNILLVFVSINMLKGVSYFGSGLREICIHIFGGFQSFAALYVFFFFLLIQKISSPCWLSSWFSYYIFIWSSFQSGRGWKTSCWLAAVMRVNRQTLVVTRCLWQILYVVHIIGHQMLL